MKIKVEQHEIETAVRKDSHHCMIADAIAKKNPNAVYIVVDVQSIRWSDLSTGERYICLTPPKAQQNILAFDRGEAVEPFEFDVNAIVVRRMGWQADHPHSSRKGKKYNKTGKHIPRPRVRREFGLRVFE